jgi:CheY-like chemotaxis protein
MNTPSRSAVILVVEDDPNDVTLLRRAFKEARVDLPMRVARDGQEAIDYLSAAGRFQDRRQYPFPCLVVLDLKMPRKNGLEVLEWVRRREDFKDLPVFMVTSSGESKDQQAAQAHGVEAYRVKPASLDELVRIAEEIRVEAEDHCRNATPCAPTEEPPKQGT